MDQNFCKNKFFRRQYGLWFTKTNSNDQYILLLHQNHHKLKSKFK